MRATWGLSWKKHLIVLYRVDKRVFQLNQTIIKKYEMVRAPSR